VISARPHKGRDICLLKLEGVTSREKAEQYRGAEILCDRALLPREEEEYFWDELLGLEVYLETGERIGSVSEIIPLDPYDIYVVKGDEREVYIPAAHEMIQEIDLENGKMIVTPEEGMLELNEV
jgi:16S rRNA processing protein RimM